jgi:hypothetical protein
MKCIIGFWALGAMGCMLLPVGASATKEEATIPPPSNVMQQINPLEAIRSGAIVIDPKLQQAVHQKMLHLMEETMTEILSDMGMAQGKKQQILVEQIRNNFLQNRLRLQSLMNGTHEEQDKNP